MGKMFTTKKRVRPVFVEDTDKTMFAEVCPAYGLPADFYEMGAMDELGFYYVLKSLKNGMAEFSDLKADSCGFANYTEKNKYIFVLVLFLVFFRKKINHSCFFGILHIQKQIRRRTRL